MRRSVTQIVGRLFPFPSTIPPYVLEKARQRGIAIHEFIESYNELQRDGLVSEVVTPFEYMSYCDQYIEWFNEYEVVPIEIELKMEHDNISGVIDLLCKTKDDELCLVSFKATSVVNKPYCELQESGYRWLLTNTQVIDKPIPAYVLHIKKDGYKYMPLENQDSLWLDLVKLDRYLVGHKK